MDTLEIMIKGVALSTITFFAFGPVVRYERDDPAATPTRV